MTKSNVKQLEYLNELEELLSDPKRVVKDWSNHIEDKEGNELNYTIKNVRKRAVRFCIIGGLDYISTSLDSKKLSNLIFNEMTNLQHRFSEKWTRKQMKVLFSNVRKVLENE